MESPFQTAVELIAFYGTHATKAAERQVQIHAQHPINPREVLFWAQVLNRIAGLTKAFDEQELDRVLRECPKGRASWLASLLPHPTRVASEQA